MKIVIRGHSSYAWFSDFKDHDQDRENKFSFDQTLGFRCGLPKNPNQGAAWHGAYFNDFSSTLHRQSFWSKTTDDCPSRSFRTVLLE